MKILTEAEIQAIVDAWLARDPTNMRAYWLNARAHCEDIAPVIAEAQAKMTRQETLKEVVEWVDKLINQSPSLMVLLNGLLLLKGEMSGEADCHIEPVPDVLHT